MDNDHLPGTAIETHTPAAVVHAVGFNVWARIIGGVVTEMRRVENFIEAPFGDTQDRVVNVSAVPCAVGYIADTAGNVAPPPAPGTATPMPGPGERPAMTVEPAPAAADPLPEPSEAAQAQHDEAVSEAHE